MKPAAHAASHAAHQSPDVVRLKRLGIDTYQEPVIFLASSSPVCRSEGWMAQSRVEVSYDGQSIVATLNMTSGDLLAPDEAGLSEAAWLRLGAREGDFVRLSHAPPVESMSHVRTKAYGGHVDASGIDAIVRDIAAGRFSDIELAAFVTAFAAARPTVDECVSLAQAMVANGERLYWGHAPIVDKHCVGGLPGNRTSMIVVPIVAACGLTIPKTSSRSITSPAGTADAMETVAPVDLDLSVMRRVVEREGGCIAWGGRVRLAPADDVIISVERPLDFDSPMQLVASVLSKKVAAGSTHVVIDIPIGPTAKVRSVSDAVSLEALISAVAGALGITVRVAQTDGRQPVGRGVGPALEARDVLAVLRGDAGAPADLRDRALFLAGEVLELGGGESAPKGSGRSSASEALASGAARRKFEAICEAQGGMREPPRAAYTDVITATRVGQIAAIDNRRLARIAKLAGAPRAAASGLEIHVELGDIVRRDQPLITLHAETRGELEYAQRYLGANPDTIALDEEAHR
jgi:thymidine phosphorylase